MPDDCNQSDIEVDLTSNEISRSLSRNKLTAICRRMMSTAGEQLSPEKWRAGHRLSPCKPHPAERKSLPTTSALVPRGALDWPRPLAHFVGNF